VKVDLRDAGRALAQLGIGMNRAAERGLLSAAIRGVQIIQSQIIPSKVPQPVDRGLYRAGWKWGPVPGGGELWNSEPHAPLIEFGVRAGNIKVGRKMIDALTEWAMRKGIASDRKEARRVAWAIARRMKKRGIFNRGRGLGILKELMTKRMPAIIREEIKLEVARELARRQ